MTSAVLMTNGQPFGLVHGGTRCGKSVDLKGPWITGSLQYRSTVRYSVELGARRYVVYCTRFGVRYLMIPR